MLSEELGRMLESQLREWETAGENYAALDGVLRRTMTIDGYTLVQSSEGVVRVNTANEAEEDNTLPITSAAVHTNIGNIEILLETI